MLSFEFNAASIAIPGYLGFQKLLRKVPHVGGAFDMLELYDWRAADEFLKDKVGRLVRSRRAPELVTEDIADACLAFAVMCVLADRENRGEFVEGPPPPEALEPMKPEQEMEADQTGGHERVQF